MTAEADKPSAAADQPSQTPGRNDLLRRSRLRRRSPSNPARPMSQRELAEAVTAHVQRTTGRDVAVDRHVISRWESGKRRFPTADYRDALRAVLGIATDAELGFQIKPWTPPPPRPATVTTTANTMDEAGVQLISMDGTAAQPAVNPGPAVILASATPELLNAVVPLLAALKSYHGGDEPPPTTVGTV